MRRLLTVLPLLCFGRGISGQERPPADTVWTFHAPSAIQHLRHCAAAEVLFATKGNTLIAVDAATGKKLWQHDSLPNLDWGLHFPCDAKTGISYRQNQIVAFDLVSGQRRWDAGALPGLQEIRGYAILHAEILLLFLRTAMSDRSLAAVRLSSGERLWQRDDLFQQPPAFAAHGGVSDIDEFQSFIMDGDTSLFLYVTADGPVRLDLRSGATVWTGQALAGTRVPDVAEYAGMRVVDSTLIIPGENGLVALNTRDGTVRWRADTLLPRHATRLAAVGAGLLVRAGSNYTTVLDPLTGTARWARPLTIRTDGTAYAIVEDRYYLISKDRFYSTDLATGDTTRTVKLGFQDNESASQLIPSGDAFYVLSRQNIFRVDAQGALRYARYFHAPGANIFQTPGAYGSAYVSGNYAYFVTDEPDSAGRRGNSILRILLEDGTHAGRLWLREKAPTYWPDTPRDQLLLLVDDKTLVAVRFPSPPARR